MKYEIEVPRAYLRKILRALIVSGGLVVLIGIGYLHSPPGKNGLPRLLTPHLVRITAYQQAAGRWVEELQQIQAGLSGLLTDPEADLLQQDGQANVLQGRLAVLSSGLETIPVPATLEALHAAIQAAANRSLLAAGRTIRWISEPTLENHASALAAVEEYAGLLSLVRANPWWTEQP